MFGYVGEKQFLKIYNVMFISTESDEEATILTKLRFDFLSDESCHRFEDRHNFSYGGHTFSLYISLG